MDSAFIPAFTLAVNYYSLVRPTLTCIDLRVCVRKSSGQKTAMSILDHQHRTQLRLRVQRRVRLWGFSSRRLRFMLVLSLATSDFTSSLLVMGCASPADFSELFQADPDGTVSANLHTTSAVHLRPPQNSIIGFFRDSFPPYLSFLRWMDNVAPQSGASLRQTILCE
jgi:hypothetical protein